jgi:hypothetical protein
MLGSEYRLYIAPGKTFVNFHSSYFINLEQISHECYSAFCFIIKLLTCAFTFMVLSLSLAVNPVLYIDIYCLKSVMLLTSQCVL